MSAPAVATTVMQSLDKALKVVHDLGIAFESQPNAPVIALVSQLAVIDQDRSMVIAKTLQQSSMFNALVRDNITGMSVHDRYESITRDFDSIREDAKRLAKQAAAGKPSLADRAQNTMMLATRGSIPARFNHINSTYQSVSKDSAVQIRKEGAVLDAYMDYRVAMKQCNIEAEVLLSEAQARLDSANQVVAAAQAAVTGFSGADAAEKARLELARDQSIRAQKEEDSRFQIAKDLRDNIVVSYNTSEVVMARLQQLTEAKKRVYAQATIFFSTNETVLTALEMTTTSTAGLAEATKTTEAMKRGVNQGLEDLAEVGNSVLIDATKTGYGATINSNSVAKLVDAIVKFQEEQTAAIADARKLATENANEIGKIVEDGKKRFVALSQGKPTGTLAAA